MPQEDTNNCFNGVFINANLISVSLKSKRQRINTITYQLCLFYLNVTFKELSTYLTLALNLNLAPKTSKRFADDSHARFNNRE